MLKLWRRPDAVKGTWRIRGTLGGRRYDESTGTDSRHHAEAILARRQTEVLDAITFGPQRTTSFGEAAELYIKKGGEKRFLEPLLLAFGPRRLSDITQADVERFVAERYPNTGPQGVNRQVYTPIIAVYRFALRAKMGPAPSFIRPDLSKLKEKKRSIATDEHITRVLPHCSYRLRAAILLMTLGGARASESCRVMSDDVDWQARTIILHRTKNGDPAVIAAGDALMSALAPLRGAVGPIFGFSSRFSLNQALARACRRAGIPEFSSHEIGRHSFSARHLRDGKTLLEVQKMGRWKSYRMVSEVYGHLEQSSLDESMRDAGRGISMPELPANVVPLAQARPLHNKAPAGTLIIYIVRGGDYLKIGLTNEMGRRAYDLATKGPVEIVPEFTELVPVAEAYAVERLAHEYLQDFRVRGEWFCCTMDEAMDAIALAIRSRAAVVQKR